MNIIKTAFVSLLLSTSICTASATTITFDKTSTAPITTGITESGFLIDATSFFFIGNSQDCGPGCADDGTNYAGSVAGYGNGAWTIRITAMDGKLFTLKSFSGSEMIGNNQQYSAAGILVEARPEHEMPQNAGLIDESFLFDEFNDGLGGGDDFQTFNSTFGTPLKEVFFTGICRGGWWECRAVGTAMPRSFAIDNIVVDEVVDSEVPEPSTTTIFGLGLLSLIGVRRKAVK